MAPIRNPFNDLRPFKRLFLLILIMLTPAASGYARASTIFLPLIAKQSPVLTLQNGDFETVPNVSWKEENSYSYILIIGAENLLEGITPQGGSRAVWLLGDLDETSTLSQTFYVPVNAASLSYFYWIRSDEDEAYCGVDQAYVRLNGLNGTTSVPHILCKPNNTNGWMEGKIDLAPYRGQVVELVIGGSTAGDVYSDFFLDTVSVTTLNGN